MNCSLKLGTLHIQSGLIETNIKNIVKDIVSSFSCSPKEINNGLCLVFAEKLKSSLDEAKIYQVGNSVPIHAWVVYKGKCYDAETPNGVKSFKSLPYLNRLGFDINNIPEPYEVK